jgi:hypothetical protein
MEFGLKRERVGGGSKALERGESFFSRVFRERKKKG